MTKRLSTLLADVDADLRAAWQAENPSMPFEEWKTEQHAKKQAEEDARIQAEIRAERRQNALKRLETKIPPRYRSARVTDQTIASWCEQASHDPTGSLLILGPVGVGKSYEAFGALRHLTGTLTTPAEIVVAADLYAEMRPRAGVDSETVFERYARAGLLLVDDIGAAKASEWTEEIDYRLINHRYNYELPTIFTSNTPPRELAGIVGQRVASRLTEMCTSVVLTGQDRRKATAA